ncbi:MAG: methyltransferase domain-containing protein, partial [Myxococcota bacterium]
MDPTSLETAAALCRLVDAPDLLRWLGLGPDASSSEAQLALERQRKRMQSMQGNPKFRALATFLIKNHRKLDDVLADVPAYLDALATVQQSTQMPLLELAIDGVLADGVLTDEEAVFVRDQAMKLGIAVDQYERVLRERCEARGVPMPVMSRSTTPGPASTGGPTTGTFRVPLRTLQVAHRAAGAGWWDDAFTRLLCAQVPDEAVRVVDLACGLGWAALALLPARAGLEYLGIDPNELHVDVARRNLAQAGLAQRAMVHRYDPANLPLPDGSVDVVLSIMSLQSVPDTRPLFRHAARVLRAGGRFVVVEPDCFGQQFWFDGNLPAFDAAFRALCERVDERVREAFQVDDPLGRPGLSLGPVLGARMRAAGLDPQLVTIHPVQVAQQCTFPAFARRLRKRVESMRDAGQLTDDDPAVNDAFVALGAAEAGHDELRVGTGVH